MTLKDMRQEVEEGVIGAAMERQLSRNDTQEDMGDSGDTRTVDGPECRE